MAKEYKVKTLKNGEKRYIFDVNIGYRADGSRIRKTVTSKTVKDGREKVARLLLTRTSKTVISKNDLFKNVYDTYIIDCENKGYSPTTLENIRTNYRKQYTKFENVKVSKIKDIDIKDWILDLKKKYANETVRTREAALNAFFNWCIKNKVIDVNQFIYIDKTKSIKPKLNFWTEDQFKEFLKVVDCDTHKLIFTTLFYTGLRKGELCGLSIDDLNIQKNELHLSHTVKVTSNGFMISTKFKTENSKRVVPIPRWLTPQLEEFLKIKDYPFEYYYRHMNEFLTHYLSLVDLPKIRIHDFRHSYVSMLINKGVDIYTVKEMVGHGNIKTTINTYGDLYPDKRSYVTSLFD